MMRVNKKVKVLSVFLAAFLVFTLLPTAALADTGTYTVTVLGGGYIGSDPSTTTATVDADSLLTVTAPAVSGQLFAGWSRGMGTDSTDNPYTFEVKADITLTADYVEGFAGFGTATSPYQIGNEADLIRLASLVNGGEAFIGRYFIVTRDITMSDDDFTPIGSYGGDRAFSGSFDGNGKTIYNLNIDVDPDYAGLFSYLDGAAVTGLTVSGAAVSGSYGAGAIAGYANKNVTVSGCTVTGCDISADGFSGGMIGDVYEDTSLSSCAVTASNIYSNDYAGGMIGNGSYYVRLSDCTVTGCDIDAVHEAGGIAAYIESDGTICSCSVSSTSVDAANSIGENDVYAGGIVGYIGYDSTISNCRFTGVSVNATGNNHYNDYAGGIVGYAYSDITIGNCGVSGSTVTCSSYSAGGIAGADSSSCNIVNCAVSDSTVSSLGGSNNYVGGISGWCNEDCCFTYCTVSDTDVSGVEAGGITSWTYYNPIFDHCIVAGGEISGVYVAAGIAAVLYAAQTSAAFSHCRVTADISLIDGVYDDDRYIGGMVAYGGQARLMIDNCEYNGAITAAPTSHDIYAGGLAGYNYNDAEKTDESRIANNAVYGSITTDVSGNTYAGGLIAYCADDISPVISNNVLLLSATADHAGISGYWANNICAYSSCVPILNADYVIGELYIERSEVSGYTAEEIPPHLMNSAFWTGLGFTAENGWRQITEGMSTPAAVEAHLATQACTLTVSGCAVPYFMNLPLASAGSNTYTAYAGMEITIKSAAKEYKISGVTVNGTAIASPWRFTVAGDTAVVTTAETNAGDFWVYDGYYIYGVYPEDSTYQDFNWKEDGVSSAVEPLTGAYGNANVYVLNGGAFTFGRLNLGRGSVVYKGSSSLLLICGADEDSFLIARGIANEAAGGSLLISNLDVYADAILINDRLDISHASHVMAGTVTIVANQSDTQIYGSSSLTAGTIYAAVGGSANDASMDVFDDSVLTADDVTGSLGLYATHKSIVDIKNNLVAAWADTRGNASVTVGGDLTVTGYDSKLYSDALLNVGGTITTADGNYIDSLNAAILNAQSGSDTPYYNGTGEAYIRTTLTGLPANTLMRFTTFGVTNIMDFWARTNYAGMLTVWLIPDGGGITAVTAEGIEYSCADAIGDPTATFNMGHAGTISDVTVTADVPEEQVSGQAVSYSNIAADSRMESYVCDEENLSIYLTDAGEQAVPLDTLLPEGTYYLTVCYNDGTNQYYGTATYTVHVRDQRTITFDANGGSAVDAVLAFKGDSLTLPPSARSGYRLTGWTDGALSYAPGSAYPVYVDSELTAQWTVQSGGGSMATYCTITANAGGGGGISPSGSISITSGGSKTFTVTPDDGYVIKDVLVDGRSAGAVSRYTFSSVIANHTIEAVFAKKADPADPFTDLIPGAWYMEGINYVLQAGLFNGTSETTFSPGANMTRAMLVTVLWRLSGEPDASINSIFHDVDSGLWYSGAVAWATANGVVSGYGDGFFGTNDDITREQIAVILYNYAKYMGYDTTQTTDLSQYSDSGEISGWAADAMAWANAAGLISGRTATTLAPGGDASRAEVAVILMRFIESCVK